MTPGGGIEGKWAAMTEERDLLRDAKVALEGQVEALQGKVEELEKAAPAGLAKAVAERTALQLRVRELETTETSRLLAPDEEEKQAFDLLVAFMGILRAWGLKANRDEVTAAVHVLQGFVIQHMLQRLTVPGLWGEWYDPEADERPKEERRGVE